MPNQNHQTLERILNAGKGEFLSKGFKNASLRNIASIAGVTTGAIYGYFPDKKALFGALVEKPAKEIMEYYMGVQTDFDRLPPEEKVERMHDYTQGAMDKFLELIYSNLDAFKLIVNSSHGTSYENYLDRIVEIEEEHTYRFIDSMRKAGHEVRDIRPEVMHILCSANYHGLFQVVAHDMPKEEALEHIQFLIEFYRAGWNKLLGL